jgi:hypothetical protein
MKKAANLKYKDYIKEKILKTKEEEAILEYILQGDVKCMILFSNTLDLIIK